MGNVKESENAHVCILWVICLCDDSGIKIYNLDSGLTNILWNEREIVVIEDDGSHFNEICPDLSYFELNFIIYPTIHTRMG